MFFVFVLFGGGVFEDCSKELMFSEKCSSWPFVLWNLIPFPAALGLVTAENTETRTARRPVWGAWGDVQLRGRPDDVLLEDGLEGHSGGSLLVGACLALRHCRLGSSGSQGG